MGRKSSTEKRNLTPTPAKEETLIKSALELMSTFLQDYLRHTGSNENQKISLKLINSGEEKTFEFNQSEVVLGRSVTCDIKLQDRFVSREHARIFRKNNAFYLTDLGSTNGTNLNRLTLSKADEYELTTSDLIQIERFQLLVEFDKKGQRQEQKIQIQPISYREQDILKFFKDIRPKSVIAQFQIQPEWDDVYFGIDWYLSRALLQIYQSGDQSQLPTAPETFNDTQKRFIENVFIELEEFFNTKILPDNQQLTFQQLAVAKTAGLSTPGEQYLQFELEMSINSSSGKLWLAIPRKFKQHFAALIDQLPEPKNKVKKAVARQTATKPAPIEAAQVVLKKEIGQTDLTADPRFERLNGISTLIRLEIGKFPISSLDLLSLKTDQTLILKNKALRFFDNKFDGLIRLQLVNDNSYSWLGQLTLKKNSYFIEIREIIRKNSLKAEISGELIFPEKEEKSAIIQAIDAELLRTISQPVKAVNETDLLRGIKLFASIELSQIKLKIGKVVQLKPGQTIKIPHPLSKNIRLLVDGTELARGTLEENNEGCGFHVSELQV